MPKAEYVVHWRVLWTDDKYFFQMRRGDLLIHFDDQLLVVVERRQRPSEREQALWAIVTLKRFHDSVLTALWRWKKQPTSSF